MEIHEDLWLSDIFGYGVHKVSVEESDASAVCETLREHVAQQSRAMYYAKVDTHAVNLVRLLGKAGMYVVDVNVTLNLDAQSMRTASLTLANPRCAIEVLCQDQHQAVVDIAATSFRFSRFHLDPLIPDAVANRIKHDWVLNYTQGIRGEELLVASMDGRPSGFLAVLKTGIEDKQIRIIDLVGVSKDWQRRGVGAALVASFIDRHMWHSDSLQVGTQVANTPSIRLYQRLGFLVAGSSYVMHMHVQ